MTRDVLVMLGALTAHFAGDFLLQSDRMATGKSTSWSILSEHCALYALTMAAWGLCVFTLNRDAYFWWLTLGSHFLTDAVTSRINAGLWQRGQRHWFFVAIGADQLVHAWTIAWTISACGGFHG